MPHICDILFIVTLYITENFENSDFHGYNVLYRILHTLKFPVIFQTFFIPLFVPLTDEEVEKLKKSADALKSVIAQIEL
jgi:hypothetical protein